MSETNKSARSVGGKNNPTDEAEQERINALPPDLKLDYRGFSCGTLSEPVPSYIKADCETVEKGANNSWLVFGRDRPGPRTSGYGGRGDTQAGAIDIVVGRMGWKARSFGSPASVGKKGPKIWTDPDFTKDAARIYISQKTDVDSNFGLAKGKVGEVKSKSAIALKADGIRIVAREGIKLVTRTDRNNSQGGEVTSANGIDLLATNNDEELQPIPKGRNLTEALERLAEHISKLNGVVDSFIMYQDAFNKAVTHHTHYGPAKIIETPPVGFIWETTVSLPVQSSGIKTSIDLLSQDKRSLMSHKINLATYKKKYLSPEGKKYINSRYNNTT